MSELSYFAACSLDGYIAGTGGRMEWLFHDQDYGYAEFYQSIEVVLMGRKTFQYTLTFEEYPYKDERSFVLSRTLRNSPVDGVAIIRQDPASFVKKDLRGSNARIWAVGGFGMVASLFEQDLMDELLLPVHPITIGGGILLFPQGAGIRHWKFEKTQPFETGLVQLTYRRAK